MKPQTKKTTEIKGKPKTWGPLLLFVSLPTLLCCALPIVLVSLGMGSVVASLYSNNLVLQWLGLNSPITFGVSAFILLIAAYFLFRSGRACPTDPALAKACANAHKWNVRGFILATIAWCIGAITAFILPIFL